MGKQVTYHGRLEKTCAPTPTEELAFFLFLFLLRDAKEKGEALSLSNSSEGISTKALKQLNQR